MNKTEHRLLAALQSKTAFKQGNTQIHWWDDGVATIRVDGVAIAHYTPDCFDIPASLEIHTSDDVSKRVQVSRLNALLTLVDADWQVEQALGEIYGVKDRNIAVECMQLKQGYTVDKPHHAGLEPDNIDIPQDELSECLEMALDLRLDIMLDKYPELEVQYSENAPQTGKGIRAMFEAAINGAGKFRIYSGANNADDLYFTPAANLLYRTVHDIDHAEAYVKGYGTTKFEHECYLNTMLCNRVYHDARSLGYSERVALLTYFTVYADTVGQAIYYHRHHDFVADQRKNTKRCLAASMGYELAKAGHLNSARSLMDVQLERLKLNGVDYV